MEPQGSIDSVVALPRRIATDQQATLKALRQRPIAQAGISILDSNPANNMDSVAPNAMAGRVFSAESLQLPRKAPVLPLLRISEHEPASLSTDSGGTSLALPARRLKSGRVGGSPTPVARAALRSCPAWLPTSVG